MSDNRLPRVFGGIITKSYNKIIISLVMAIIIAASAVVIVPLAAVLPGRENKSAQAATPLEAPKGAEVENILVEGDFIPETDVTSATQPTESDKKIR